MPQDIYTRASALLSPERLFFDEPMARHTTFSIGGAADILAFPRGIGEIKALISLASEHHIPVTVIGNGSNILVRDGGIRGMVLQLQKNFAQMFVSGTVLSAQAGASLAVLAKEAAKARLSGLEFASGIPGTLGGAVYMNAGAYEREIKELLLSVTALNPAGEVVEIPAQELVFSYRHSSFCENGMTILEAQLQLSPDDPAAITERMDRYNTGRREKQPLQMPSAGSVFKRPAGAYAAALIEQAGLKGLTVGGAQVSPKHAGFIVNIGGATCGDVCALIQLVQEKVKAHSGYSLETEVRILGEDL